VDSACFLNVIKKEPGLWADSIKILMAAERGDIHLVASTLILAEVGSHKGDVNKTTRDQVIEKYLENLDVEWAEVDLFTVSQARQIGDQYKLRGADAVHLTTAVRRRADYFVSRDKAFPYGQTIDKTQIVRPIILWNPTIDDFMIDSQAAAEAAATASTTSQPASP
jgi:predicted nucleic acid-binding protein